MLYVAVALVLTGIAPWTDAGHGDAPVADALKALGYNGIRQLGQSWARWWAWCPRCWCFNTARRASGSPCRATACCPTHSRRSTPRIKTPHVSTWVAGLAVGIPAGIWDIGTFADLANIGTLFAFIVVSAGVIVLRRSNPNGRAASAMPGVPWLPHDFHRASAWC